MIEYNGIEITETDHWDAMVLRALQGKQIPALDDSRTLDALLPRVWVLSDNLCHDVFHALLEQVPQGSSAQLQIAKSYENRGQYGALRECEYLLTEP